MKCINYCDIMISIFIPCINPLLLCSSAHTSQHNTSLPVPAQYQLISATAAAVPVQDNITQLHIYLLLQAEHYNHVLQSSIYQFYINFCNFRDNSKLIMWARSESHCMEGVISISKGKWVNSDNNFKIFVKLWYIMFPNISQTRQKVNKYTNIRIQLPTLVIFSCWWRSACCWTCSCCCTCHYLQGGQCLNLHLISSSISLLIKVFLMLEEFLINTLVKYN